MRKMRRVLAGIFCTIVFISTTTTSNVHAAPIDIESPDHGWRTSTATWDCIPIAMKALERNIAALSEHIERAGMVTSGIRFWPAKSLSVACAIAMADLLREKIIMRDLLKTMEARYREHKSIKYKTRSAEKFSWYRLVS